MEFYLTKVDTMTFKAAYDSDAEAVKAIPIGESVCSKYIKTRNVMHHRKFFAMLKMVMDNMPEAMPDQYQNIDFLLDEIKYQVGHVEIHITLGGKVEHKPKSIDFARMDQVAFEKFYNQAIDVMLKYFLKDLPHDKFEKEVMEFL